MDEATLKRATEPFFTTKGTGKGTGLGLSMVDGLAAQSGGAMRIASQLGAGTTVELWLPVSPAGRVAVAGATTDRARARADCARAASCVVDDDPMVAAGHRRRCSRISAMSRPRCPRAQRRSTVLARGPGDRSGHHRPCDAGHDRQELAERIRRSWPGLPVVIATGYAELTGDGDCALPRLSKPYRQRDVAVLLARLVGDKPASFPPSRGLGPVVDRCA